MIGNLAPSFEMPCVTTNGTISKACLDDYRGRWLALVFYPRDFSFVCPTELSAISADIEEFEQRSCDVLAVSVDTVESHRDWRNLPDTEGGIGPLRFPIASDTEGQVSKAYGVWLEEKRVSLRGLFLIDPDGVVQFSVIHNLAVGRNVEEVLRVLDALKSGGLCPASWRRADGTIDLGRALRPGRVLGHYRLMEELGSGAFGRVYSSWDLQLERKVALKILMDSTFCERFFAEARAVARIDHPNVCGIYSVEINDGLAMIAMPLIEGSSLESFESGGESTENLKIAQGIAQGIAAAHSRGIVHGDLKPANILLDHTGAPQIVDFGLAKVHRPHKEPSTLQYVTAGITESLDLHVDDLEATMRWQTESIATRDVQGSSISGTPAYMSPEQLLGGPATLASDVYSFGLILRDLLCGKREYRTIADVIQERLADVRVKPPQCTLARRFIPLMEALLHRDPSARPSMDLVVQQLSDLL